MNQINRALVKSQAKEIIRGKVFVLFLISFVVTILTGGITYTYNISNTVSDLFNNDSSYADDNYSNYYTYDYNYFGNFGTDDSSEFGYDTSLSVSDNTPAKASTSAANITLFAGLGSLSSIIAFIFAPLAVTLAGMYVSLVRRNANEKFELGSNFSSLFKNTFDNTWGKKFLVTLLVEIITTLLCILLIVPGIIFSFSAYFSKQIMVDYPNLKPSEAIKLSKKIVRGNRTELFAYELSFIPWYLLAIITIGIANIYIIPYKSTCDALYYENFRLRALAEGRVNEDDFLSEAERFMKYQNVDANNQQNSYYQPNNTEYQPQGYAYQAPEQRYANNNGTFFTPDFSPIQQYNPYDQQPQNNEYYQPTNNQNYYQPPQQPEQPEQPTYYQPPQQPEQSEQPTYYQPPQENENSYNNPDDTNNNF